MRETEIRKENWVIGKLEEYYLNLKKEHVQSGDRRL